MNEVISNYKKLRFYIKNSNIPFDIKDIGIKNYNTNEIRITYKGWAINTWWDILDDCLVWDKTREGLFYWYGQHLNLVYYAMLVSDKEMIPYFRDKIAQLLERCAYAASDIKFNFIKKCEEKKLIDEEIILKWKKIIEREMEANH